jgi:hypothetical protein
MPTSRGYADGTGTLRRPKVRIVKTALGIKR